MLQMMNLMFNAIRLFKIWKILKYLQAYKVMNLLFCIRSFFNRIHFFLDYYNSEKCDQTNMLTIGTQILNNEDQNVSSGKKTFPLTIIVNTKNDTMPK